MIDPARYWGDAPTMNHLTRGHPEDSAGWPELRAAQDLTCDGENPTTGSRCVLGHHNGYHRDGNGAEWLDD
jgi:hypothetical protein